MSEFSERPASRYDEVVANMRRGLQERLYGLPWDELRIMYRQALGTELGARPIDSMLAATTRAWAIDNIVLATFKTPVGPGESTPDAAPAQPDYQGRHLSQFEQYYKEYEGKHRRDDSRPGYDAYHYNPDDTSLIRFATQTVRRPNYVTHDQRAS